MKTASALLTLCFPLLAGQLQQGNHTRCLTVDGLPRKYYVHVPPSMNSTTPLPVVLVLHGGLRAGDSTMRAFGFNEMADRKHFLAVYPNGQPKPHSVHPKTNLFWNPDDKGFPSTADDVKFISSVLDDLSKVAAVNPKRIYSTGLSHGAMMSYRLACDLSHRIAAIAPVAGSQERIPCNPRRPVPVLDFHGTEDGFVPVEGGGPFDFNSADYTISTWLKLNGCPTNALETELPDKVDDGTHVTLKTYGPCNAGTEVVSYIIHHGGHTWPGLPIEYPDIFGERILNPVSFKAQRATLGNVTMDINANDLIWEFFSRHALP